MLCLEVFPPLAFGCDLLETWGVLLLAVNSHDFYVISREFGELEGGTMWSFVEVKLQFFYGEVGVS